MKDFFSNVAKCEEFLNGKFHFFVQWRIVVEYHFSFKIPPSRTVFCEFYDLFQENYYIEYRSPAATK